MRKANYISKDIEAKKWTKIDDRHRTAPPFPKWNHPGMRYCPIKSQFHTNYVSSNHTT